MAPHRRRRDYRCPIPGVPANSVLAAPALVLLLVLAVLSFLALSLLDPPSLPLLPRHRPHLHRISSNLTVGDSVGLRRSAATMEIFRVPRRGGRAKFDLWGSKLSMYYHGCSNASRKFLEAKATIVPDRYLLIATSGGLNQQRTGIVDSVVAARILNATLVVPKLDERSFWKDASKFAEIFDVDWFISFLSKDVKIIKELPKKGSKVVRVPYRMRVPRKCSPRCYQNRVLPVLLKKHVVQLSKFDYRLANKLGKDLQRLRCRVNYHALRFTNPIQKMGETLIRQMKAKGKHFIALHLRFEPDMLAFSGCYYGGGDKERRELGALRKRWKTLHIRNPDQERRQGRCPLTPEEVGLMLRALGYGSDVHIYVASGEIYGGEETLAPLKALFPHFHSKETLARKEELAPFSSFSSRMAALDFIVCDGSDAFVTNNNGNMARILAGRRRYLGHKRTIRPNSKKLYSLFLNRANMTWEAFASRVQTFQKGFMGEPDEIKPGRGEFHENPAACLCEKAESLADHDSRKTEVGSQSRNDNLGLHVNEPIHYKYADEVLDWSDSEDGEVAPLGKNSFNGTNLDDELFISPEYSSLEEIISD